MRFAAHLQPGQLVFPAQAWYDLLESFRNSACQVVFDELAPAQNDALKDCSIVIDQSVIMIGGGASSSPCAPACTRWDVVVSTTLGRSARALFIQYAIPYHALVFFPGVTVHDCQYHLGRTAAASSWSTAEGWFPYAERALWRLGIIPFLWCVLSGAVTWTLGSPDALVMLVAALVVVGAVAMTQARQA